MIIEEYTLPETVKGNSFVGVEFTLKNNGVAIDITGATIDLVAKIWDQENANAIISLSTGSGITITDSANGVFEIDEQIINVEARCYVYDIKVTFVDSTVRTYIHGEWNILQNYS